MPLIDTDSFNDISGHRNIQQPLQHSTGAYSHARSILVIKDNYTHDYRQQGGMKEDCPNMFHIHALKQYLNGRTTPTNAA
jgi:hypothetical protein